MSKTALIAAIAGCVLAVDAFAALTATVIVDDESGGTRVVRLQSAPGPRPGTQQRPGQGFGLRMPGLRTCLQQHDALTDGTRPDPQKMRDAMKACMTGKPSIR